MTRDEHRKKCIEAVKASSPDRLINYVDEYKIKSDEEKAKLEEIICATAEELFDSLHNIARVNPIEPTSEMIQAGQPKYAQGHFREMWRAMSTAGDLTNKPGQKP